MLKVPTLMGLSIIHSYKFIRNRIKIARCSSSVRSLMRGFDVEAVDRSADSLKGKDNLKMISRDFVMKLIVDLTSVTVTVFLFW